MGPLDDLDPYSDSSSYQSSSSASDVDAEDDSVVMVEDVEANLLYLDGVDLCEESHTIRRNLFLHPPPPPTPALSLPAAAGSLRPNALLCHPQALFLAALEAPLLAEACQQAVVPSSFAT